MAPHNAATDTPPNTPHSIPPCVRRDDTGVRTAHIGRHTFGLRKAGALVCTTFGIFALTALAGCSGDESPSSTSTTANSQAASSPMPTTAHPGADSQPSEQGLDSPRSSGANRDLSPTTPTSAGAAQINPSKDSENSSAAGANSRAGHKSLDNPESLVADLRAAIADGTTPGDFFVAGGQQLTACTVGDGYALHIVAAANNTSCEFAQEVMRVQTRELNPTNDNIRDHLSPNIEAKSPITQELYNVNCGEDSSGVITCTGGNNAKIYMY